LIEDVKFYAGTAASSLKAQGSPSAAGYIDLQSISTTGAAPPSATSFPASTPAVIQSADSRLKITALGEILFDGVNIVSPRRWQKAIKTNNLAMGTSNTWYTVAPYNSADSQGGLNCINLTTGLITIPQNGVYRLRGYASWGDSGAMCRRDLSFHDVALGDNLPGAQPVEIEANGRLIINIDTEIRLTAGQQLYLRARRISGSGGLANSMFSVETAVCQVEYLGT
jgi:hypothetical protein